MNKLIRNYRFTVRALPFMKNAFAASLEKRTIAFKQQSDAWLRENPFGMPIAGGGWTGDGVVVGVLILKPDFPGNKEDWPFFWGENEYVVNLAAQYRFLANAANALATAH